MEVDLDVELATPGRLSVVAWVDGRARSAGYAQATRHPRSWSVDMVVDASHPGVDLRSRLVTEALAAIGRAGGGTVNLWVSRPTPDDDEVARRAGLVIGRDLLQLRRPLPLPDHATIAVRPFRLGEDDDAWLAVNNRAFAGHAEQGGWDAATLHDRASEPWFDPSGFLLHEQDGRLVGFCWTKVHHDEMPPMGEIYVIAVDPDFAGRGLGRELTLAGLDHLAAHGLPIGMLYVDARNERARRLYEHLGFTVDHVHRAYTAEV